MNSRNLHPSDELALIFGEIAMLGAREAELRAGFLSGKLPVAGAAARIEIRQRHIRVSCKDRLPPAVLGDPRLRDERAVLAVVVQRQPEVRSRAG